MIFLVMEADGSRIIKTQSICGPNVAILNATLMFSLVRIVDMIALDEEEEEAAIHDDDDNDEGDRNDSMLSKLMLDAVGSSMIPEDTKSVGVASKWILPWKTLSRRELFESGLHDFFKDKVRLKCKVRQL